MQHNDISLQLERLHIKNFRCFNDLTLDLQSPVVLIEGINGTGKTSILEALYYSCYLRSFRTHWPRELLQFNHTNFFIKAIVSAESITHEIQVGFSGTKRLVKVNQKVVSSYKELMNFYRVVSLTEDDLELINGGPHIRRAFIDHALLLHNPEFMHDIRTLKQVADHRNSLLKKGRADRQAYTLWTEQLWDISHIIQYKRQELLAILAKKTQEMIDTFFGGSISIVFEYQIKKMSLTRDAMVTDDQLYRDEQRLGRSLFGAHLDDINIIFQDKKSKSFASRGQQKLIIFLLKIAQIQYLKDFQGSAVFLIDDFMTDFDELRAHTILAALTGLNSQLIFTCPVRNLFLEDNLKQHGLQHIKLTI